MLLTLCALFFAWLAVREIFASFRSERPEPIFLPYLSLVSALAVACAWPPLSAWRFERFLEEKALLLTEGQPVSVHCNTLFDTMLDQNQLAAGHANPATGEIVFQKPWCSHLRDYLDDPQAADEREINSLNLFTHEAMHIRGELNEAVTECQAVQRNYRAARLLGVPDAVAKDNARRYYSQLYVQRQNSGAHSANYHSADCVPGGALDERLPDSTWGH
jgi:hypothetical protein